MCRPFGLAESNADAMEMLCRVRTSPVWQPEDTTARIGTGLLRDCHRFVTLKCDTHTVGQGSFAAGGDHDHVGSVCRT